MIPTFLFCLGCQRNVKKADIPDSQELLDKITYLDSLTRSAGVDSMIRIDDSLSDCLDTYAGHARSPEDKAILDSLSRIHATVKDYLRFCTDTRPNLEMLRQDTKSVVSQYRSGKIKVPIYISALLEDEQVLNDILQNLASKRDNALKYLHNRRLLVKQLTPLSIPIN
jgi:hypothetical protein